MTLLDQISSQKAHKEALMQCLIVAGCDSQQGVHLRAHRACVHAGGQGCVCAHEWAGL